MIGLKEKSDFKVFTLHVLLTEDENEFVAHCLELDIVATGQDELLVKKEINSLIKTHIEYAIENDNMAYLFSPAPPEIWKELLSDNTHVCSTEKISITSTSIKRLDIPQVTIQELCYV